MALAAWFAPSALGAAKNCSENAATCTEVAESIGYGTQYTGHDEPALLFYSNRAGSGNSNLYTLVLPKDPSQRPTQDGLGATWNFQQRITFWFGMDMCDTQSAPNFQHTTCTPDSDSNIFDSPDPAAPDYIGHHPGGAFMEMQFYPPGWAPWPAGVSCDAVKWCAALNIDSLSTSQVDNTTQNSQCLNKAGVEPVSFAFITKSGVPHASPDPTTVFTSPFAATTVDPAKDFFMDPGDVVTVDMHDTPAGFQVVLHDLTTGETGSMTASIANGFRQVLYEPKGTCHTALYAYHPMYATSSEHTRLTWTAHGYNVAMSDEIGHFEFCDRVLNGNCHSGGATDPAPDADDNTCFSALESLLVGISGCIGTDNDFDGPSYQPTSWPGNNTSRPVSEAVRFTSPLFNGSSSYDRVAFEADLPRIEAADFGGNCNRTTGENCVNPPPGANFYPLYSTTTLAGRCFWQQGGPAIPGTTNNFGGTSTAEYGPLFQLFYPIPGGVVRRFNDFRNTRPTNPC
ncbi:MAG: hypothetical protein HOQ28_08755 [Thermoleophilia bacterium]|nr:hypothetical protein [Thermoleophilia bacterium]